MCLLVSNIFMSTAYFGCQNTTVEENNFFYKKRISKVEGPAQILRQLVEQVDFRVVHFLLCFSPIVKTIDYLECSEDKTKRPS